jgi:hypothetical protein
MESRGELLRKFEDNIREDTKRRSEDGCVCALYFFGSEKRLVVFFEDDNKSSDFIKCGT